jgi:hydrogenase expression/formation protein HypE
MQKSSRILLSHGSGGSLMHQLIRDLLLAKFDNPILKELGDSAVVPYKEKLAFTTDSFVVSPLKFPGGDIGKLAVCGTVNDLVMAGAAPEYLSLALIIEEGLEYKVLQEIVDSIARAARAAGVKVVAGDLKVVEKAACDKLFINTCGIGRVIARRDLSLKALRPGDKIIVSGDIGQHGLAVLAQRKNWDLGFSIKSDAAALNTLIVPLLEKKCAIKFMRDPTRGGLATTLNEIAQASGLGIEIEESSLPISAKVKVAAELLGIEPLHIANEGVAVLVVEAQSAPAILRLLRRHPLGKNAKICANMVKSPRGRVVLNTALGTQRVVDMLFADPLPRIC